MQQLLLKHKSIRTVNNNKMKTKYILISVFFFSFFSCQNKNEREKYQENLYSVLNTLVHDSKEFLKIIIATPPPPPSNSSYNNKIQYLSEKDSLGVLTYFYRESSKRKVISIESNLFGIRDEYNFRNICNINKDLLDLFNSKKEDEKIDISKITDFNKDTIIQFKKDYRNLPLIGGKKIDLLLNFSRIAFNKDYNKAIVILGELKGHLDGHSSLIYLEKENYHWKIKCQKILTIS